MRLLLRQRLGGAAHHAHGHQAAAPVDGGGEMTVLPPGAGHAADDGAFLGGEDDVVEVALKGARFADDVGAGHVGDVAVDFAARVDEHELTGARGAGRGFEVQHGGIRAGAHDGTVAGARGAVPEESRLQLDLQRALGHAGADQAGELRVAGRGRRGGAPEQGEFMGVLRPAGGLELVASALRVGGVRRHRSQRGAEHRDRTSAPRGEPSMEGGEGSAGVCVLPALTRSPSVTSGTKETQPVAAPFCESTRPRRPAHASPVR